MPDSDPRKLAEALGVPFFDTIDDSLFDPGLVSALPVDWARRNCALPVRLPDGSSALVVADAASMSLAQSASIATGRELKPAFAARTEIMRAIDEAWYAGRATSVAPGAGAGSGDATPGAPGAPQGVSPAPAGGEESDLLLAHGEPAERFWADTILEAIRKGASDIHVDPQRDETVKVRFRIAGTLYEQPPPPPGLSRQIASRAKILAHMDIAEHRLAQDGMMQVRAGGRMVDVRASTIPVADGERVVLRLLSREDSLRPLSGLGMPQTVLDAFRATIDRPNGIVAVCGPTGSGKTTTLYSALCSMDSRRRNIMTIEDPVEYRLQGIAQIQVKPKIGFTFAAGLRHVLRQDPDVILVGETRDSETAEIAVRASLTGHLVFTTLHTNDAPSAPMRLVDMGVEPYLLASCLRGVLAQRLVRRVCPACVRIERFGSAAAYGAREEALAREAGCAGVAKAVGCASCLEGYAGRTGIFEFLPCGGAVAAAIHGGELAPEALRTAAGKSYLPMSADALDKLSRGETTPAEILAALGS
ncbi:MAG: type II/IV secretion system protein [Kiritimatiellae bacterium]|nr:type II/IV secretion system protein [Kiritimatiellia bacterium]